MRFEILKMVFVKKKNKNNPTQTEATTGSIPVTTYNMSFPIQGAICWGSLEVGSGGLGGWTCFWPPALRHLVNDPASLHMRNSLPKIPTRSRLSTNSVPICQEIKSARRREESSEVEDFRPETCRGRSWWRANGPTATTCPGTPTMTAADWTLFWLTPSQVGRFECNCAARRKRNCVEVSHAAIMSVFAQRANLRRSLRLTRSRRWM